MIYFNIRYFIIIFAIPICKICETELHIGWKHDTSGSCFQPFPIPCHITGFWNIQFFHMFILYCKDTSHTFHLVWNFWLLVYLFFRNNPFFVNLLPYITRKIPPTDTLLMGRSDLAVSRYHIVKSRTSIFQLKILSGSYVLFILCQEIL